MSLSAGSYQSANFIFSILNNFILQPTRGVSVDGEWKNPNNPTGSYKQYFKFDRTDWKNHFGSWPPNSGTVRAKQCRGTNRLEIGTMTFRVWGNASVGPHGRRNSGSGQYQFDHDDYFVKTNESC